jgi:hypothetical protein
VLALFGGLLLLQVLWRRLLACLALHVCAANAAVVGDSAG